jgi:hypothetical protein
MGFSTGQSCLGSSRPLITMKCHFDGSVGGYSDEWLTLGGFAATDATWATIDKQWKSMLRDRYPIAPYVHMTDLITGNDPFERKAGWTDCKVEGLVSDIQTLLGSIPTSNLCAFACSIDMKARKRLIAEGYQITDPAVICAENGIGRLLKWYDDRHPLELAHLFYDQNEPFIRSIRRRWLKVVGNKKLVTDELFWGRIANVQPVCMHDTPGIQAADVVAWAFTRRIRNEGGDPWANLANTMIGSRQGAGILTCTQLDPITEEIMRSKYSKKFSGATSP